MPERRTRASALQRAVIGGIALLLAVNLRLSAQQSSATSVPIAVEARLAAAAHLHVGDTVRVSTPARPAGEAAWVAAIYRPPADPATIMRRDYHVRFHLVDLARLLNQPDQVDRMGVVLRHGIDPDTAADLLNRTAFGYQVKPSRLIASKSSTTFLVVSRFHRAIAIISVLASSIFLLCLMLLKVEERRRDVAVLRFTGISRRTVFVSLLIEAGFIALAGSAIGTAVALAVGRVINTHYQHAYQTTLIFSEIGMGTVLFAVGLSVALGLVAGALASWRLVRLPPSELWSRAA